LLVFVIAHGKKDSATQISVASTVAGTLKNPINKTFKSRGGILTIHEPLVIADPGGDTEES
jgi:hypothetical protein